MRRKRGKIDVTHLMALHRDHNGAWWGTGRTICNHSGQKIQPWQTCSATVMTADRERPEDLTVMWTCIGQPCLSAFTPFVLSSQLSPAYTDGSTYKASVTLLTLAKARKNRKLIDQQRVILRSIEDNMVRQVSALRKQVKR